MIRVRSVAFLMSCVVLGVCGGCLPVEDGEDLTTCCTEDDMGMDLDASGGDMLDASKLDTSDTGDKEDLKDSSGMDAGGDMTSGEVSVGVSCEMDEMCGGGFCAKTSYPGGYCTKECMEGVDGTCPADSACVNLTDKGICLKSCMQDDECRDGYECFLSQWCLPKLEIPDVPVGQACTKDEECMEGYCATDLTGGYCTVACGFEKPCPDGSTCYGVGDNSGDAACFKDCMFDRDCRQDEGYICDEDNACFLKPDPKDFFESMKIYNPCSLGLWLEFESAGDMSIASIELEDTMQTPIEKREYRPAWQLVSGQQVRSEIFSDTVLTPMEQNVVRIRLSSNEDAVFTLVAENGLPQGMKVLEARNVEVRANMLEVTLRSSFAGVLDRATLYDMQFCRQVSKGTLMQSLTSGQTTLVAFPGEEPATGTKLKLVLEGDNQETGLPFYDVIDLTIP